MSNGVMTEPSMVSDPAADGPVATSILGFIECLIRITKQRIEVLTGKVFNTHKTNTYGHFDPNWVEALYCRA